ncbi:MAG: PD-(D/E)XK nuclease family protein [Saprospiraceae bacterium]|nr:PD-(D/E)XK nuclease family protein [Saprospiraceae bacterium]
MILHFGTDFDGIVYTDLTASRAGETWMGPRKLLQWFENQLGINGYSDNTDYIRIELYRQAMGQHLGAYEQEPLLKPMPFYAASFGADRFAAAATLLNWRDELLLAGWDFESGTELPERLQCFSAVEELYRLKINDPSTLQQALGYADRFAAALVQMKDGYLPLKKLVLHQPEALQKPHIQRFIKMARQRSIPVEELHSSASAHPDSVLGQLQQRLLLQKTGAGAINDVQDHSLLILRARRDSDAATVLSQLLRENRAMKPVFLIPEMNLLLEQSMVQEGMPNMGILSTSLARPSLQVLKLAPAFLWEPVDVFKIMEFATLSVKPLDYGLSLEIARVMAEKPGLMSDTWFAAVFGYLEQGEVPETARKQYAFWFDRRRYKADSTAPKRDAISIYAYLQDWALEYFEENGSTNTSFLVLAEQARRIRELLEALPEQRISFLELERIVRTIYQPSPVQFAPADVGRFDYVHQSGALAAKADTLIWWNCLFENTVPAPDKWQINERQFLEKQGVVLLTPEQEGQLNLLRQVQPVLQTSRQLILVVPDQADGAEVVPNLLLGDIEAAFPFFRDLVFSLDEETDRNRLSAIFSVPERTMIPQRLAHRTRPHLMIRRPEFILDSAYETPTNLDSLFYYPHRWFFRQQLKMYPSSLLSVTGDNTLLGSLSHRFFEKLLKENLAGFDRRSIQDWVDNEAGTLLEREGATLLLYGREPERQAFLNRVKNAAWNLVSLLRNNAWEVLDTELPLEGIFGGVPVRGKADLVLQRGEEKAIVDLKWSGANRRKELIRNGEDLQLVLYAKLLPPPEQWPHTAYFILDEGKMIARNQAAFREAVVAGSGEEHGMACTAIFEKMERTYAWRLEQLRRGIVELRTNRTAAELEALYEGQLFELLEMKMEDARWDDYRTLLV